MGSGNRRTRVRKSEYVDILLDSVYDVNICRQGQIGSINFWTVRALFGARTKSRKSLLQLSPDSPIIARLYFPCYPFIGISTRATRDRDTRDTAEIRVRPNLDNARNPLPRLSALLRKPENKIVRPSSNQLADRQRRHRAPYRSRAIVSLISGIINVIWKTVEDSSLFSISSSSFFFSSANYERIVFPVSYYVYIAFSQSWLISPMDVIGVARWLHRLFFSVINNVSIRRDSYEQR